MQHSYRIDKTSQEVTHPVTTPWQELLNTECLSTCPLLKGLDNSFKGGHVDGNSVVKRAFHGVITGWVSSLEVSHVRQEVLHQPYLVKALPPDPQRYQAGMPARDWDGVWCQAGVQGVAGM